MKTEFEKNLDILDQHGMWLRRAECYVDLIQYIIKINNNEYFACEKKDEVLKNSYWNFISHSWARKDVKLRKIIKIKQCIEASPIDILSMDTIKPAPDLSHWKITYIEGENFSISTDCRDYLMPTIRMKFNEENLFDRHIPFFYLNSQKSFEEMIFSCKEIYKDWEKITQKIVPPYGVFNKKNIHEEYFDLCGNKKMR